MHTNPKVVGSKIRALRLQQGMTQAMLAEACNVDESTIRAIENGRRNPRFETLVNIAEALNVPLRDLYDPAEIKALSVSLRDLHDQDEIKPLLVLEKVTDDGNAYGFDRLEIVCFNYDGEGGALVKADGELEYFHPNDLDCILHGVDGVRWYRPIWRSPDCPEFAPLQ